jgi:hypothetical protein
VSTAFEKAWQALNKRLALWSMFRRTDVLAGLGRYSVLLLGAPGKLEEPLDKLKPDDLLYLQPFAEEDAQIRTFITLETDERFGQPETYQLTRSTESALGRAHLSRVVHWTRVIHVADGQLDDNVYGTPRLQRVWNYLDDLDKVSGGGAEAYWKRADQGLQINVLPETKFSAADGEALADQVEEYIHGLRRVLRTRGVDVNTLGSDVAGLNPVDQIMMLVAATMGVPQRILEGSERGELASSTDKSNFDDTIADRRMSFAHPVIVKPFVERLIDLGALPEPKDFLTGWPDLDDLNESQKADMATRWAGLNSAMGEVVVKPNEVREVLGLEAFTEEELAAQKAEKEEAAAQAMQQMQQSGGKPLPPGAKPPKVPSAGTTPAPAKGKGPPFAPKPAEEDEEDATLEAATAKALTLAIARGRAVLDTPALRAAIANRDVNAMHRLLYGSTLRVGEALTKDVARLL